MKIRTFAGATTTFLGAALIGYGQVGAPDAGQAQQPGAQLQQAEPGQQAQQAEARQEQQQLTEAERADRAAAMRELNWMEAQEAQIQLNEIPEAARNTLTTVTEGAQLEQQVTRLTKDEYEVFRATVTRPGQEDLQIFVAQDGSVIQTKQAIAFDEAPESVQNTIRQQFGEEEPQQFFRVIADDETSYAASTGEGPQAEMIRVDNAGNLIGPGAQAQPQAPDATAPEGDLTPTQPETPAAAATQPDATGAAQQEDR